MLQYERENLIRHFPLLWLPGWAPNWHYLLEMTAINSVMQQHHLNLNVTDIYVKKRKENENKPTITEMVCWF